MPDPLIWMLLIIAVFLVSTYIPHPKARNMGQFKRQLNQVDNTRNILI